MPRHPVEREVQVQDRVRPYDDLVGDAVVVALWRVTLVTTSESECSCPLLDRDGLVGLREPTFPCGALGDHQARLGFDPTVGLSALDVRSLDGTPRSKAVGDGRVVEPETRFLGEACGPGAVTDFRVGGVPLAFATLGVLSLIDDCVEEVVGALVGFPACLFVLDRRDVDLRQRVEVIGSECPEDVQRIDEALLGFVREIYVLQAPKELVDGVHALGYHRFVPTVPDGYGIQTETVEFTVSGDLDGITLSPALVSPARNLDPQQIYRPPVVTEGNPDGNLGLIDVDYLVSEDGPDKRGARGPRYVSQVWITAPAAGAAGASLDLVDNVDGTPVLQEQLDDLSGLTTFFRDRPFIVPQGSMLRVSGFTNVPGGTIQVRISYKFLTDDIVAAAQAVCACEEDVSPAFAGFMLGIFAIPVGVFGNIALTQQFTPDPTAYSHISGSPFVTILRTGRYEIGYEGTAVNGNNSRSTALWAIFTNRGGADFLISGLIGFSYHRDITAGQGTVSQTQIFDFEAGDIVRLSVRRFAGAGVLTVARDGTGLFLERIG